MKEKYDGPLVSSFFVSTNVAQSERICRKTCKRKKKHRRQQSYLKVIRLWSITTKMRASLNQAFLLRGGGSHYYYDLAVVQKSHIAQQRELHKKEDCIMSKM